MKFKKVLSLCLSTVMLFTTSNFSYANELLENLASITVLSEEDEVVDDEVLEFTHDGAKSSPLIYTDSVSENSVIPFSEDDITDEDFFSGTSTENYYMAPFTSLKSQYSMAKGDSRNCWIFSALAAVESKLLKDTNVVYDLSEEHVRQSLLGGTMNVNNAYRYLYSPNTGGFFDRVMDYWMRGQHYGLAGESSSLPFRYSDKDKLENENISVSIYDYYPESIVSLSLNEDSKENVSKIKDLVRENGNAVISYYTCKEVNKKVLNEKSETSSTYSQSCYLPENVNFSLTKHAIEVVGWDDDYSRNNFVYKPQHNGAFIVKNSYGENYSYDIPTAADGFIYISYDQVNRFSDVRSIRDLTTRSEYIYENNLLGRTSSKELSTKNAFIVNKFDNNNNIYLNKVAVDLHDTGTTFKVYISPTGAFEDLREVALKTTDIISHNMSSGYYDCEYTGVFLLDLETYCFVDGCDFLVGIEYYNNSTNISVPIENFANTDTCPVINEEYSYLLDTSIVDYSTITDENNYIDYGKDENIDFCIKAYGMSATSGDIFKSLDYGVAYDFNTYYSALYTNKSSIAGNGYFIANGSENVAMNYNTGNATMYNNHFTHWCTMSGKNNGTTSGVFTNTLQFKLKGNAELFIIANVSAATGKINLLNSKGQIIDSKTLNTNMQYVRFKYTGNENWVYLSFSSNYSNALNIYSIKADDIGSYVMGNVDEFWNFTQCINRVGTYTSGEYIENENDEEIYFAGSSENPIYVEYNSNTLNGVSYNKCVKFDDVGDVYSGSIMLYEVPTKSYIYLLAKTPNNYTNATIKICDVYGIEVSKVIINDTLNMYKVYYTGPLEDLYITMDSGSVRLYGVGVRSRNYTDDFVDKEWDFDSGEYYNINSISGNMSVDDLQFFASDENKMYLKNSNNTLDNKEHRRYLAMEGGYQNSGRQLAFNVDSNCNIKIIAKSSGTDNRELYVVDKYNYTMDKITVTSDCTEYTVQMTDCFDDEQAYSYVGNGDTIYLRSAGGGINIYAIKLESATSSIYITYSSESISEALGDEVLSGTAVYIEDVVVSSSSIDISSDVDNIEALQSTVVTLEDDDFISTNVLFYEQLDTNEKNIYDKLVESFVNNKCTADITDIYVDLDGVEYNDTNVNTMKKSFRTAMSAFINDHPEVFWLNNEYTCYIKKITYNDIDYISKCGCIIRRYKLAFSTETSANNAIVALENKLDSIATDINDATFKFNSNYLKLKSIFNDLVTDSSYTIVNKSTTRNLHNSYGTLCLNYGSCTGLSKAFKLICDELGYNCIVIRTTTSSGNVHACNLVEMEGLWYVCDLSMAIDNDNIDDYFMVPLFSGHTLVNPTIYINTLYNLTYPQNISELNYYLLGDVDFDGQLTANDSAIVISYVLNSTGVTQRIQLNGDVDGDGVLTANDSTIILQMVNTGGVNTMSDVENIETTEYINVEKLLDMVNDVNLSRGISDIDIDTLYNLFEEGL